MNLFSQGPREAARSIVKERRATFVLERCEKCSVDGPERSWPLQRPHRATGDTHPERRRLNRRFVARARG